MRDIDSTETRLEQVEHKNIAERIIPSFGSSHATIRDRMFIILSLLSLYFLWGGTYLAMRIALQGFPPFILAGVRQLTAGILLFLFLWLRKHELPTRKQWLTAIIVGGLLLVVGNGGVVFAEQWVSSGLAALALGAIPLWAAVFSGLFGRWPTRIEWFGLGLGFSGLVLLNLENG
ncbi:MAG TPA: EamA family transporter, partial [Ktedonobacteraceae bacterium]|nr:EamA family transporter [Ktedonobacteraceae bacterium]